VSYALFLSVCTTTNLTLGTTLGGQVNPSNDCTQDCLGIWGGEAVLDNCNICDDNPSNDCTQDCLGIWGGDAALDNCNVCDDNPSNDCLQDCLGIWGGDTALDNCNVCDDNPSNDCLQDCLGIWGGDAVLDNCNICDNDTNNDCIQDCVGNWGGNLALDDCGVCGGNGWDACDEDEDGISNFEQWGYGPYNLTVNDIPNDQGGRVYVSFHKSFLDDEPLQRINSFSELYTIERKDIDNWVSIQFQAVYGSEIYTAEATTLENNVNTIYRVIAIMEEGLFISNENGEGESIDNIIPSPPDSVFYSIIDITDTADIIVQMNWSPPIDEDFSHFNIYRNNESLVSIIDNNYSDSVIIQTDTLKYYITTTDENNNESYPSETIILTQGCTDSLAQNYDEDADIDNGSCDLAAIINPVIPLEYGITNIYPNPFNPITNIKYDLPEYSNVHISIFNLSGNLIQILKQGSQNPGSYIVSWDAGNHPTGMYFVRMVADESIFTQKLMLIK